MSETLIPVAIYQVKRTPKENLGRIATLVLSDFLWAWLVMLIAGAATPWQPSYWEAWLVIWGVRFLGLTKGSGWQFWTHTQKNAKTAQELKK